VWPAYVEAHRGLFANGDFETGALETPRRTDSGRGDGDPVPDLMLIDALRQSMEETFVQVCQALRSYVGSESS
jgi:hypothetical protein